MITAEATVSGSTLRLSCHGVYDLASEAGWECGKVVEDLIRRHLDQTDPPITEIVIDFTEVDYQHGDGPAWSVLLAVKQGVPVTYHVREQTGAPLLRLLATTHLNRIINVVSVP